MTLASSSTAGDHDNAFTYDPGSPRSTIPPNTNRNDAITPWQEKQDWQQPGPILKVAGDMAFIIDAEKAELVTIDVTSGATAIEARPHRSP